MPELRTKSGVLIARTYIRVVHGDRGDYVEFVPDRDIIMSDSLRPSSRMHRYYYEWRTVPDNVKLYEQRMRVDYADYRQGYWYVSPRQLVPGWETPE